MVTTEEKHMVSWQKHIQLKKKKKKKKCYLKHENGLFNTTQAHTK